MTKKDKIAFIKSSKRKTHVYNDLTRYTDQELNDVIREIVQGLIEFTDGRLFEIEHSRRECLIKCAHDQPAFASFAVALRPCPPFSHT